MNTQHIKVGAYFLVGFILCPTVIFFGLKYVGVFEGAGHGGVSSLESECLERHGRYDSVLNGCIGGMRREGADVERNSIATNDVEGEIFIETDAHKRYKAYCDERGDTYNLATHQCYNNNISYTFDQFLAEEKELGEIYASHKNLVDGEEIIRAYYKYITEGRLKSARLLKGDEVSAEVFGNRYKDADHVKIQKFAQISDDLYKIEVDYSENKGQTTDLYTVVMRVDSGKIYTQSIHNAREITDLGSGYRISTQDFNGKNELYLLINDREILMDSAKLEYNGHKSYISYGSFEILNDRYVRYWMYGWEYGEQRIFDIKQEKRVLTLPVVIDGGLAGDNLYYACTENHMGGERYVDIFDLSKDSQRVFSMEELEGFPVGTMLDSIDCSLSGDKEFLNVHIMQCNPKYNTCEGELDDIKWTINLKTLKATKN